MNQSVEFQMVIEKRMIREECSAKRWRILYSINHRVIVDPFEFQKFLFPAHELYEHFVQRIVKMYVRNSGHFLKVRRGFQDTAYIALRNERCVRDAKP